MKGVNLQTKETIYYPKWTRIATVTETQLAKRMARGSTFSVGEINGVFADFPQSIIDELLNGNAVKVAGLGEFKLKVTAKADADPEKVTTRGAKASILFEPDAELAARIETEAEFKVVTTPTSEGQKDADNATTPTTDGEGGDNQQPGGGDDNGGNGGGNADTGDDIEG